MLGLSPQFKNKGLSICESYVDGATFSDVGANEEAEEAIDDKKILWQFERKGKFKGKFEEKKMTK